MAYTEPVKKTLTDRTMNDPADWNTFIRDNMEAFKAHVDATAGIHGLPGSKSPLGIAQGAGIHLEGITSEVLDIGAGWGYKWVSLTWTFMRPFATKPVIVMGAELTQTGWVDVVRRVGGVAKTGVELRVGVDGDNHRMVRICGTAVGREGDEESGEANDLAWRKPKTWADGMLLNYPDWNSYVVDDERFIQRGHVDMTERVHGLARGVHPVGYGADGCHAESLRRPIGDQGYGNWADLDFVFADAFGIGTYPVVVSAAEFNADTRDGTRIKNLTNAGCTVSGGFGLNVYYFYDLLAIGED